ncbi:MAG: ABC transporter ATP-binding protein, partial [Eubacteriaceae bacterium]|nr:ABC transporter ATP-binding protein [Eubacteriaceae bacterium]
MSLLKVENLTKRFKDNIAVDTINFDVEKGDIFGLLGPNGAGKSTTISIIATLIKEYGGKVYYRDQDILKNPSIIQNNLGFVPQEIALYPTLKGIDNLKFWGRAYGLQGKELETSIDRVSEIIGIRDRLKDRVDKYSGGMKRRLNIGVALLHKPEMIIMDEPTVGIDPQSRKYILDTVKRLRDEGSTIIYTSHYMEEVEYLCTRICIMDKGKIIGAGTQDELVASIEGSEQIIINLDEMVTEEVLVHLKNMAMIS